MLADYHIETIYDMWGLENKKGFKTWFMKEFDYNEEEYQDWSNAIDVIISDSDVIDAWYKNAEGKYIITFFDDAWQVYSIK